VAWHPSDLLFVVYLSRVVCCLSPPLLFQAHFSFGNRGCSHPPPQPSPYAPSPFFPIVWESALVRASLPSPPPNGRTLAKRFPHLPPHFGPYTLALILRTELAPDPPAAPLPVSQGMLFLPNKGVGEGDFLSADALSLTGHTYSLPLASIGYLA